MKIDITGNTSDREFIIERMLNAPRELVWEAWTDPEHLINWWGPKGFTNTFQEINIHPGGIWRFIMHGPDGNDYQNRVRFDEVFKPERLAYMHGSDEDPEQFYVIVEFTEQGDKTKLKMHGILPTAEIWEEKKKFGATEGGNQTIDKLELELAKMLTL